MIKFNIMKYSILIAVLLILCSCKNEKSTNNYLGVVKIEIRGKESAVPYFEKGLLLLHSFEYEDAREAFKQAQLEDPQMAMAYWGEAMTYNHSLWSEQDYDEAVTALKHLDEIDLEQNTTRLEQDFIAAVKLLYQPNTEKPQRDIDYSKYMESLFKKYPSNHEVAAFYALSLLGSVPDERDEDLYGKGALIAQGILKENPNHPGALHYLIHSYDDPNHANLALDAAYSYSKVAPDASHALHMPSHIFVAMGMWDQVIASNINSYQASLNRMERKKLDNDARGYHAYHWLEYGYLQKENISEAKKMVLELKQFVNVTPSKRGRSHLVFLKGTYLVESDDWESEVANIPVDVSDLNISTRSKYHFLEGMKAYHSSNKKQLDSVLEIMENDFKRESFLVANDQIKICSGVTRDEASKSDLVEAQIRRTQLQALRELLDDNLVAAEEYFKESISLEESISYSYGPPQIQKPTRELYADWLVSQNKMEDARDQYELILKTAPKRLLAIKGIEKSKS
jgi:tetratricopeptide (TPR) repeat protein